MMTYNKITTFGFILIAAFFAAGGCSEDFDKFNEIQKLRVLAIKAEPPAIQSGASTELTALVFEPPGAEVTYAWSWCPLTTGGIDGYNCAVEEEQLRDLLDSLLPGGSALLPSFDMGTDPTANFSYSMPAELIGLMCGLTVSEFVPAFTVAPSCEESFDITVRLEVDDGKDPVVAIKRVTLMIDEEVAPNQNPRIDGVRAKTGDDFDEELVADMENSLLENTGYDLTVDVPEVASEEFETAPDDENPDGTLERENLFMSWFVTGGETEYQRTSFIEGSISLEDLGGNNWRTPKTGDTEAGAAVLYLVLQDERGGVEWITRDISLEEK